MNYINGLYRNIKKKYTKKGGEARVKGGHVNRLNKANLGLSPALFWFIYLVQSFFHFLNINTLFMISSFVFGQDTEEGAEL